MAPAYCKAIHRAQNLRAGLGYMMLFPTANRLLDSPADIWRSIEGLRSAINRCAGCSLVEDIVSMTNYVHSRMSETAGLRIDDFKKTS